ncbi:hypothetical protein ACHAWT_005885 [Skeletonema menzelii]
MTAVGNYGSLEPKGKSAAADRGETRGVRFGGLKSSASTSSEERIESDSWFHRDFSIRGGFGQSVRNLFGGGRGSMIESLLGPTDHSFSDMVQEKGGLGLDYSSVDRGIIDTAVWHSRKLSLIQDRTVGRDSGVTDRRAHMLNQCQGGGYVYDHEAVKRLERERVRLEYALVVFTGLVMAVIGVAVSRTADNILEMKLDSALEWHETHGNWYRGFFQHVGTSVALAMIAFMPVAIAPVSGGSGIAEAKAVLNGIIVPLCTDLSTALCKAISVVCSVAAGLPAGLEGPMIFLGLAIGDNANRLVPRNKPKFDLLRTDRQRIDFAAVGCAAGVAAAFRSPISGILFAMEEGSSFWSTRLTWRCFLSACVTVITMYAIMTRMGRGHAFHVTSMAVFNGIDEERFSDLVKGNVEDHPNFDLWEYAMFVVMGSLGGIVGAFFCVVNRKIAILRRRLSLTTTQKGIEVFCIAATTAILIWVLPSLSMFTKCSNLESRHLGESYFRQFNCPEGQYNELATLLLNPLGAKGITLLFTEGDADAFCLTTCLVAGCVEFFILIVAFGMSVSAGIFIPLLFAGACFGRALALFLNNSVFDDIYLDPRTYAIIGSASTLGGVARVLISLTSIVTHTVSLSFFMTPVMVACLFSQEVGNYVSGMPGIYDIILQLRGVPFLEEECPFGARHANIRARNIMSPGGVVSLMSQIKVKDLVGVLREHEHSDFPVTDVENGTLIGMISRIDCLALLTQKRIFYSNAEEPVQDGTREFIRTESMESYDSTDSVEDATLTYLELDQARHPNVPTGDNIGANLTAQDGQLYLHLTPYMQIAPITVHGHGSAERAYEVFRCLGLRSIVVVDNSSRPIGIIKRHQLALLEEVGHSEHKVARQKQKSFVYRKGSGFKNQFE